jgi:hypothetical protein
MPIFAWLGGFALLMKMCPTPIIIEVELERKTASSSNQQMAQSFDVLENQMRKFLHAFSLVYLSHSATSPINDSSGPGRTYG